MKHFRMISLAILFTFVIAGFAFATGIPQVTAPKNLPTVWTEQVYNGSGSNIATATVVEWDFDTSNPTGTDNDDMCPYVTISAGADDIWTAGVTLLDVGIPNGTVGTIIIRGPAIVKTGGDTITVNQLVGADDDGSCVDFGAGTDECSLGRSIKADAGGNGYTSDTLLFIEVYCSD